MTKQVQRLFQNKEGEIILVQFPNVPLFIWANCYLLSMILVNIRPQLQTIGSAFLITWAWLEIRYGENTFRRLLGTLVLAVFVVGLFI